MIELSEHFSYKKLIVFTIPTITMMIFYSIYGVVDGIFVSNVVGNDAFASVNLIYPAVMILASVGSMIGAGGSALVSKTLGEGNKPLANRYFSMLIYFIIISGIILAGIGFLNCRNLAVLLGAKDNLIDICVTYGQTLFIVLPFFMLQNTFQSFLIVAERPKMGLMVSIISGVINMIFDFLFVYVLQMGVFGAALATGLGQMFGSIFPLCYFVFNKDGILKLVPTKFELMPILNACSNGSSEMVSNISMSLVNILYNYQLMQYAGKDGVIAYGIIMYVSFIFIAAYLGYAIGTAPIISYHFGAKNYDELKSLFSKSIRIVSIASIVMTILAECSSGLLANIFVSYDPKLMDMTINAIMIYSLSFILAGFNIFSSSFFTALNDGLVSAIISFLRTLIFQIAMVFLLPIIFDLNGIWLSVVVAEVISSIISVIFLFAKRNKYHYI